MHHIPLFLSVMLNWSIEGNFTLYSSPHVYGNKTGAGPSGTLLSRCEESNTLTILSNSKGKGKVPLGGGAVYSTTAVSAYCTLTPQGVPSFISRGAAHQAA
jgi:hypothetical protein